MTVLAVTAPALGATRYTLRIAEETADIRAAARLRHLVFAGELGARLHAPVAGLDIDEFDAYCDHLIVVDDGTGDVVGTYRMLPPGRGTGWYSATEFDLAALVPIADRMVETGRSCVHPAHRAGAVINLIWAGLARYMHLTGHRYLAGCASIGLADGGTQAAGVWDLVRRKHFAPEQYRVTPYREWVPAVPQPPRVTLPPLLRGYLRLSAQVCGAPAYDPDFNCADLYVLLDLEAMNPRYLKHFLGATE
jgi:putative hemolysin